MSIANTWNQKAVGYLLGTLPDAERDDFEDRYFSHDDLHEQLLAIEEELIDDYVHNHLDPDARAAFESRFLQSPERLKRIEFARALAATTAPPRSAWASLFSRTLAVFARKPVVLAGAVSAAVAILLLLALLPRALRQVPLAPTNPSSAGLSTDKKSVPAVATQTPSDTPPLLAFAIVAGTRSSGPGNRISIPPGSYRVALNLALDPDPGLPRYEAVVANAEGNEVWRQRNLSITASAVTVTLPSQLLTPGSYSVKLTGILDTNPEAVAGYSFFVQRQ